MLDRYTAGLGRTKGYNDEGELITVGNDLKLNRFPPSHWNMWKRLTPDPTSLHDQVRSFDYPH